MRIAFLNFGGLGDEILFSPVIAHIKQAYPQAHVTLILEKRSQSIADLMPDVDVTQAVTQITDRKALFWELLVWLRRGQFNMVISSGSSPFIAGLLWASGIPVRVGFSTGKWTDKLLTHPALLNTQQYAGAMYTSLAEALLKKTLSPLPLLRYQPEKVSTELIEWFQTHISQSTRKKVILHPGVSLLSIQKNILKSWPIEHWAQLIEQLATADYEVILAGGPDDAHTIQTLTEQLNALPNQAMIKRHVHLAYGKTRNLHDLAWILQHGDLLVCVDSAPMHMAIALNTAIVAMFGPTDPYKLVPAATNRFVSITVNDLPCRPCLFDNRKTSCDNPLCLNIPVETVLNHVLCMSNLDTDTMAL
jgi:putative inorganic carbon (hco3(-)) transporter